MKHPPSSTKGFSLVEVVLALGITAFALIIILALLPAGLGADQASIQQTAAINLATAIVADLRQTPTVAAIAASGAPATLTSLSPRYQIDVTKPTATTLYLDSNGNSSTTLTASSRYRVIITLTQPASGRTATYGTIIVGWPAAANPSLNSVSAFIALDRN